MRAKQTRKAKGRLRRMFVVGLLLAVALVMAAPTIISRTPLRNVILNSRLAPRNSQLTFHIQCEQAVFSWLGGQSLAGLSIVDEAGRPVLAVEAVSVDRSLVQLLASASELGKIQIVQPRLTVTTRTDGSNVEDFLSSLQETRSDIPDSQLATRNSLYVPRVQVEIVDGIVEGHNHTNNGRWVLSDFNTQLQMADGNVVNAAGEGMLKATSDEQRVTSNEKNFPALLAARPNSPGNFKFRLHSGDAGWQQLDLFADRLALDVVSPWFARVVPGGQITGTVSLDGVLQWDDGMGKAKSGKRKAESGGEELVAASGSRGGRAWKSSGKLESSQLRIAADVLASDVLECERLTAPWRLAANGNMVHIEQLNADTEWGNFAANGVIDFAQLAKLNTESLPNQDGQLEARFDMARLAAMLPNTMRIRRGVRIDSGDLQLVAKCLTGNAGSGNNRRKWTTRIALHNLAGHDGTRRIRWDQPVELEIDFKQPQTGSRLTPRISRLLFQAPFLEANLKTAAEVVDGNFSFDLEKLTDQVGQLVDMSPWQMRGQVSGTLVLQSLAGKKASGTIYRNGPEGASHKWFLTPFSLSALVELQSLNVARQGQQGSQSIWTEPQLRVNLQASGLLKQFQPQRIDTASMQLRGASDSFELQLIEPVDITWKKESGTIDRNGPEGASHQWFLTPFSRMIWPISVQANGPLDAWAGRLRPWTSAVPDKLRGNAVLTATMRVGPKLVDVSELKLQATQLHVRSGSYVLDEPQVQLTGDCRWDAGTAGSLTSGQLQLVTSTVALLTRNVAIGQSRVSEDGTKLFEAHGDVSFRGDMERLAAALDLVGGPTAVWPRGMATGQVRISTQGSTTSADLSIAADQLQIIQTNTTQAATSTQTAATIAWTEPHVDAAAKLTYDTAADQLRLDDLRLVSQSLQLQGSATVDKLTSKGAVRANGLIDYDWDALSAILAAYLGPEVQLHGKDQAKFQIAGNLFGNRSGAQFRSTSSSMPLHWSQQWTVSTDVRITSGSVYGMPLGVMPVQLTLGSGMLQTVPIDVPVGQGHLMLNPRIVFYPQPRQLLLPQGPLVTNVRVSPEVSERMLKYIAPVVAGATRTDGLFSIQLEGARVPLNNPQQADITGQLVIHQLNVSPGQTVQEMVKLVEQIEALAKRRPLSPSGSSVGRNTVTIDNRIVDFRVFEGRAYHRGLEFIVDGVPVRSSGSVGFDQTLAIIFEVPIQDKWVEHERALQPLAGQVLQIPIHGTFQQPQIDQRAVADLSRRMFQDVAERAIGDEINRQFNKLFRSR